MVTLFGVLAHMALLSDPGKPSDTQNEFAQTWRCITHCATSGAQLHPFRSRFRASCGNGVCLVIYQFYDKFRCSRDRGNVATQRRGLAWLKERNNNAHTNGSFSIKHKFASESFSSAFCIQLSIARHSIPVRLDVHYQNAYYLPSLAPLDGNYVFFWQVRCTILYFSRARTHTHTSIHVYVTCIDMYREDFLNFFATFRNPKSDTTDCSRNVR